MELTVSAALELVSSFFPTEWPQTAIQDAELRRITGGLVNLLHLLNRSSISCHEPASVLIRYFGIEDQPEEPPASSTTLTATEQALIYEEMAHKGWGPKIYGTFSGGRLEEYINSHPLRAVESMRPEIRRDIARSYARLHSLSFPFRQRNLQWMISEFKQLVDARMSSATQSLAALPSTHASKLNSILQQLDFHHEMERLAELFEKHHCKPTIAIGDSNYLNVLVKNQHDPDCQVMLIDYKTATSTYRGIDIGGHLNQRMYDWGRPAFKITGLAAHGDDERRSFCQSYLEEMRTLGQEFTQYDTVEHLLLKAEIGMMWQIRFSVLMCVVLHEQVENDEPFLQGLLPMTETYQRLKEKFI